MAISGFVVFMGVVFGSVLFSYVWGIELDAGCGLVSSEGAVLGWSIVSGSG